MDKFSNGRDFRRNLDLPNALRGRIVDGLAIGSTCEEACQNAGKHIITNFDTTQLLESDAQLPIGYNITDKSLNRCLGLQAGSRTPWTFGTPTPGKKMNVSMAYPRTHLEAIQFSPMDREWFELLLREMGDIPACGSG